MKTYWLEGREQRTTLSKVISPQLQPGTELEWEKAADIRDSIAEHSALVLKESSPNISGNFSLPNSVTLTLNGAGNLMAAVQNSTPSITRTSTANSPAPTVMSPVEERRMYSPVTFQDVARRSIANSPNRTEKGRGKCGALTYDIRVNFW